MAARKPKARPSPPSLFALAERQLVALYNAGVLSPAVLHHVIAAYADSGIDWNEKGNLNTVDKRTVQEAVVLIMMPGRALRSAQKDFISVVEHLAGQGGPAQDVEPIDESEDSDEDAEDESLLAQLGGGKKRASVKRSD